MQAADAEFVQKVTGLNEGSLVRHQSGDTVSVGAVDIELIHTPGHTPGSQCFFVDGRLVAGDTLFLDGCGRTDFPGSDPGEMYDSLTQRLSKVPDDAILYPRSQVLGRVLRDEWASLANATSSTGRSPVSSGSRYSAG